MAIKKNIAVVDELLTEMVGKEINVVIEGVQVKGILDSFSDEVLVIKNEPISKLAINPETTKDLVFRKSVSLISYKVK